MRTAAAALLSVLLASSALAETKRVAVVMGNNAGDGSLAPLRYAEADASKFARALLEVGQVSEDDLFVLQGRRLADTEGAIAKATARIAVLHQRPENRVMLIFYYSGHSDGEAIELGGERLSFVDLKRELAKSGAEVRVEIIDACRSGAAVAQKGGHAVPAFTMRLADDLSTSGDAFVASSAADEVALESPELQGSYFTSALVSGLRGAADTSGDKQVTLAEAYRYAYDHTVSSTAVTIEGAQHPTFDFKLSGQGELVLSQLDRPKAGLVLPDGLDRALVIDVARDQVVAELLPGASRFLALSPGNYAVRAFAHSKSLGTRVELASGQTREVHFAELETLSAPKVAMKGPGGEAATSLEEPPPATSRVQIGVTAGASSGVAMNLGPRLGLRVAVEPGFVEGLYAIVNGSYGSAAGVDEMGANVQVGYQFPIHATNSLTFGVGAEAGPGWVWQHVDGVEAGAGFALMVGPRASARYSLGDHASVELEGGVAFAHVNLDQQGQFVPEPGVTAGMVFGL
ncbi:MAG: caspase family protein [Deltaproteobacteria bacterium]|nr:caspase family protein [Deltaproteobacteria bacterium]